MLAEITDIISQLVNFGGLGLAVAILFYLHTQALTTMRAELQVERERHDAAMDRKREEFLSSLREERELFRDSISAIVDQLKEFNHRLKSIENER